jgi:hypothetical protein
MSLLNQVKSFARSPAGREAIRGLTSGRSGTRPTGRRPGRRQAPAPTGIGGLLSRFTSGGTSTRGRGRRY